MGKFISIFWRWKLMWSHGRFNLCKIQDRLELDKFSGKTNILSLVTRRQLLNRKTNIPPDLGRPVIAVTGRKLTMQLGEYDEVLVRIFFICKQQQKFLSFRDLCTL